MYAASSPSAHAKLPLAHDNLVAGYPAKSERQVLPRSRAVKLVVAIRIQNPEETDAEDANFALAISIPVAYDGHIPLDTSISKSFVTARLVDVVDDTVAVVIKDPEEPLTEQADLTKSAPVPVSNHWNIAAHSTEGIGLVDPLLKDAIAVVIENPEEPLPIPFIYTTRWLTR